MTAVVALCCAPSTAQDGTPAITVPLTANEVVRNLEDRNRTRAQALHRFEGTRVYTLHYRGFPHNYDAEMVVSVAYQAPATKEFKVMSQSGSKFVIERIFKRMLESEKEASQDQSRTALNEQNYDFTLTGYEEAGEHSTYALSVLPRSKNKYLYRGRIWVDATDFAVVRIEAEPAQNPSFWIKKTEIRHAYKKIDGFWLPALNHSQSFMRIGGSAELSIEYKDYKITDADPLPEAPSASKPVAVQ
jgi:Outer membrane lipoprotein-sorting protein